MQQQVQPGQTIPEPQQPGFGPTAAATGKEKQSPLSAASSLRQETQASLGQQQ